MAVVRKLIEDVDGTIGQLVLELTLKNIREALYKIKQIVFNQVWIQRDYNMNHSGAFEISDILQYDTSPASLIRALGMNESRVSFAGIHYPQSFIQRTKRPFRTVPLADTKVFL